MMIVKMKRRFLFLFFLLLILQVCCMLQVTVTGFCYPSSSYSFISSSNNNKRSSSRTITIMSYHQQSSLCSSLFSSSSCLEQQSSSSSRRIREEETNDATAAVVDVIEDDLTITTRRHILLKSAATVFAGGSCWGATAAVAAATDNSKSSTSSSMAQQQQQGPKNKRLGGGLVSKIRGVGKVMDELQRDLMQEHWDAVQKYPAQLRSYVPVLTTYTDSAFPSDAPTDTGLRVALRYEVGRFFASLERFKQASSRKALDESYVAYSDMSLHFDRYLRVGGLYTYYDDTISLEPYYTGISDSELVYENPKKDPPLVRDLIVLIKGPDKGKTGIVIGIYSDGTDKMAIKLDRYKGMREIRLVPKNWVAKRLGEQDPDDVFLLPPPRK